MDNKIVEIAQRIRGLRDILGISEQEMAKKTDVSLDDYKMLENGESDFNFTFLYKCATIFGVDIIEILTGDKPKLGFYSITRKDKGLPIKRREGLTYQHLAPMFKNKLAEAFLVTAPFSEEAQQKEIALSTHEGQEFNYVLSGELKVVMEGHTELLCAGDSIMYDSSHGHGMIATGGEPCTFLAVVLKA